MVEHRQAQDAIVGAQSLVTEEDRTNIVRDYLQAGFSRADGLASDLQRLRDDLHPGERVWHGDGLFIFKVFR